MSKNNKKRVITSVTAILIMLFLCVLVIFISVNLGSIKVGFMQMLKGLFIEYDSDVATVYDLRFPRILIAIIAGAALSVSGVLLQAVLKNSLADPGIIGVSSGAKFVTVIIAAALPGLYSHVTIFSFLGGLFAFAIVYGISMRHGYSSLKIILVGIAVQAMFTGLSDAVNSFGGGTVSTVAAIVDGNITLKTWDDVKILAIFVLPGLVLALFCIHWCDLMALEEKTVRGLGMNVKVMQLLVSVVAVLLASSVTAICGVVGFLGLLVPHIGRLIVGNGHKALIPFSMLLGSFVYLTADTLGRTICYPYEVSAAVLMNVIGGPVFIILLQRSRLSHGKSI